MKLSKYDVKQEFLRYFEGISFSFDPYSEPPIDDIPVYKFSITGFDVSFPIQKGANIKSILIEIELARPGMLIGKGGRTINALTKYLTEWSKTTVEIKLIEFDIWK